MVVNHTHHVKGIIHLYSMKNLIVLITGASSGIGQSTAEAFAKAGHLVFGTSRKASFGDTIEPSNVNMIPMETTD